jgi:hypothetical protein
MHCEPRRRLTCQRRSWRDCARPSSAKGHCAYVRGSMKTNAKRPEHERRFILVSGLVRLYMRAPNPIVRRLLAELIVSVSDAL